MARSMTGYGAARFECAGARWRIELRSINHKHLDVRVRAAREGLGVEAQLAAGVKARVARGHVEVTLVRERAHEGAGAQGLDVQRAAAWHGELERLAHRLGIKEPVRLAEVLAAPGVLAAEEAGPEAEELLAAAGPALDEALNGLLETRKIEGLRLTADVRERLARIAELADGVAGHAAGIVEEARGRLRRRLDEALGERVGGLDAGRLEQELVLIADRSDVTEELVRLRAHLHAATEALATEAPGRRLEFLVQEVHREVNTMGSKSAKLAIVQAAVEAKVEIEKIREQVANLE